MAKIVLVSCVSKKKIQKSKAKDMYTSPLFVYAWKYAESLKPDKIFILSAKYGLLDPDQEISPYNQTLNKMKDEEVREWSIGVLDSLECLADLKNDRFIFLASQKYRKYLIPKIIHYETPLEGLGIGKQLHYLKKRVSK